MNTGNFFVELKRRNVYKVAVAYAVVSWLLIQAASILFPTFEAPAWVMKVFVTAILLGFPAALILSWAFEITPEGIRLESGIEPNKSIARRTGRKIVAVTIALAVVAAGLFVYQLVRSKSDTPRLSEAATAASSKSIAVLPFENLSEDKGNAYFAEGIQDEILTRLAKIGALKVISRTSTSHYASSPGNLPEIAKQLGVANILEGSVQKAKDAVHVNVQLIRAATDEHIWAESYDRKLDDIFAVEREVAQSIAAALNTKLTGAEEQAIAQKPTANPVAYEAYLQGNTQLWQGNENGIFAAIAFYQEAIRLDPKFALAWAGLARAASVKFHFSETTPVVRAMAEQALSEAERIDPQLADTQLARAYFVYYIKDDLKGTYAILEQVRKIWPSNYEIHFLLGLITTRLGNWKEGLECLEKAIALSPREPFIRQSAIQTHYAVRDFATALRASEEALQIWPDNAELLAGKAQTLQALGRLDEAQVVVSAMKVGDKDYYAIDALWLQAKLRRDPSLALSFFEKIVSRNKPGLDSLSDTFYLGRLQELAGEKARAQATFAAVRDRGAELLQQQPNNSGMMRPIALALAGLGEREAALNLIDKATLVRQEDKRTEPACRELRARMLTRFGDKDGAITLLADLLKTNYEGFSGPPLTSALLRLDPDFDSLRDDPRFQKLCEQK